ncbi:uncharacterized protein B0P05DRAFT_301198 [Gilbertella persicaria]|uniref:uncharacterized protein n=1 Tax=Gilbertella persicaria TaxID=101096 RepID=UPI00221F508D|nr:uncharacterized protein B0P05DRAFT_301198 [Gilbertella persicaria]KAI8091139.1 hypothetical protein B0P05DRAFT_301198 [Gilbertella persicaria]
MAEERKRILLFNCNEYVEFNNGEATLPTRVTCYCRHHSEKTGFRIVFTLKDHLDQVIGTGRSPPIMITDDHKSSKLQQQTAARKRARADMDASATESDVPSSKRKTVEIETDSGVSSPVASTPATPSSPIEQEEIPNETPLFQQQQQQQQQQDMVHSHYIPPHPSSFVPQQQQQQTDVFDFLNSHDMMNTQPVLNQFNPMNNLLFNTNQHGRRPEDYSLYNQQQQQQSQQQSQQHIYAKLQERNVEGSKTNVPRLHRLIPSEGPVYGGAEVTVLGSNFYEGLTCLFGENPAIPTHCWSANTLLCILPPATSAGPVVVSFKEHPLMLEGQDVVLFTYFDESDRALMELALQVVGLKTMGKVEDARQIAMRIVQGDNHPKDTYATHTKKMTTMEANAVYDNARTLFLSGLEHHITQSLLALEFIPTPFCIDLSLTNRHQHSLLHLATLCGHVTLVKTLIQLDCNVNQMDKNGFTALHFASWSGQAEIVQLLIDKTNLSIVNRGGKTAERLAIEAGHHHVISLFQKRHKQAPVNVRIPLTDFIPPLTDVLPTRLLGFLSHLYRTTSCAQRVVHSAGQLYHFMLDPF